MDRRLAGVALVALVLIGTLVVSNVAGRRIGGTAATVPGRAAPQVGQCLLAALGDQRSALEVDQVTVSAAVVGTCGAQNYGEVVWVSASVQAFPSTASNLTGDPEPLACQRPARRYLGWSTAAGDVTGPAAADESEGAVKRLGPWRPVSITLIALIGPSLGQYGSGQDWLACVLLPRDPPYAGSVRGGPAGDASSAFGFCWRPSRFMLRQPVPCTQPHIGESFGVTWLEETDRATLDGSCPGLVAAATGMSDPTRAGAIAVQVQIGNAAGAAVASANSTDEELSGLASCTVSVTGDRQLTQSLTGIGDGPLPLM